MGGYADFAAFYDRLTDDVGYPQRADYIAELLMEHGMKKGIVLDLACGTGSLTLELSKRGYEMIGVDASPDMLCAAQEKCAQAGAEVLFLCQPMEALDLYGTVNAAVCTLDSLNHITDPDTLREVLRRVSLFLEPGGLFVFDVNTPYKHREVLGNHTFVYVLEGLYCVWQNAYCAKDTSVEILLDFFEEKADGSYTRYGEQFAERAYSHEELCAFAQAAGLTLAGYYEEMTRTPPHADTERAIYVMKKEGALN